MSQWAKIQLNNDLFTEIDNYYIHHFPVEVRVALAHFLEHRIYYSDINPDDPSHFPLLRGFMIEMLSELGKEINKFSNSDTQDWVLFSHRQRLQKHSIEIHQRYENDPPALFRTIKNCLEHEKREIARFEPMQQQTPHYSGIQANPPSQSQYSILKGQLDGILSHSNADSKLIQARKVLEDIEAKVEDIELQVQNLHELQERIDLSNSQPNLNGHQTQLHQLRTQFYETQSYISVQRHTFFQHMTCLLLKLGMSGSGVLGEIQKIQMDVFEEINVWKLEQRRSANGFLMTKSIEELEELASKVAIVLLEICKCLRYAEGYQQKEIFRPYPDNIFHELLQIKSKTIDLLKLLVKQTFVVEKQPSQIIRTKASIKYPIKVRLLVAKVLNPHCAARVKVQLISEEEMRKMHKNPNYIPTSNISLTNSEKEMGIIQGNNGPYCAQFSGIKVPAIKHKQEKKGKGPKSLTEPENQYVAEDKFSFIFQSVFAFMEYTIPIVAISNPCVLTCHPSQDAKGWGNIFWDSMFAPKIRIPFEVPSLVSCDDLIGALGKKFEGATGKGLTDGNKRFLKAKLLGDTPTHGDVSWGMFYNQPLKEYIPPNTAKGAERFCSFHEWFFAIILLCQQTFEDAEPKKKGEKAKVKIEKENSLFQKFWASGIIEGFIDRNEMKQKLRDSPAGTFMLRFSDTVLGGVTVCWYDHVVNDIGKYLPYTLKEFRELPLGQRLLDKPHLKFLYPCTPKQTVFSETVLLDESDEAALIREGYIRRYLEEPDGRQMNERERIRYASSSPYSTSSQASPSTSFGTSSSANNPFTPSPSIGSPGSSMSVSGHTETHQRSHEGGPNTFLDANFESEDNHSFFHNQFDFYSEMRKTGFSCDPLD